jgi:hypothetical protein
LFILTQRSYLALFGRVKKSTVKMANPELIMTPCIIGKYH